MFFPFTKENLKLGKIVQKIYMMESVTDIGHTGHFSAFKPFFYKLNKTET